MKKNIAYLATIFLQIASPKAIAETQQHDTSEASDLSPQAQLARDYAFANGRCDFMLLDKNKAEIDVFEGCKKSFRTSVFLGRTHSDDPVPLATPAGSFYTQVWDIPNPNPNNKLERYGSIIPFKCESEQPYVQTCYSIHPDLQSEAERKALVSKNAAARRLSHACVRVTEYPKIEEFVRRHQNQGGSFFIVLPYDVSKTRQYLNIPANFQPEVLNPKP